jgi:hypothetical protein
MSLNESHIEKATLEWLAEMGHFCQRTKALIPSFSHREKETGHGLDLAQREFLIPD